MIRAARDEILADKDRRRAALKKLGPHRSSLNNELHHVGKISPGCMTCILRGPGSQFAIYTGSECNVKCPYCYYDPQRTDVSTNTAAAVSQNLSDLYKIISSPYSKLRHVTYNSFGETLMYMSIIEEAAKMILRYQENRGYKIYSHLYTNGMLATEDVLSKLKDLEVTELRFHLSASHFSQRVLDNMVNAIKKGFTVTVEEPALPENQAKLIELLPWFEDIGLNHLDIVECQVTPFNFPYLDKKYPTHRYYVDHLWQMYDEGMTFDIMEEILKNNYSFSAIECNSRIECLREDTTHYGSLINPSPSMNIGQAPLSDGPAYTAWSTGVYNEMLEQAIGAPDQESPYGDMPFTDAEHPYRDYREHFGATRST